MLLTISASSFAVPVLNKDVNPAKWFIEYPPINPAYIKRISRFRSVVGHPYYGGDQSKLKCQSEKHYFDFYGNVSADSIVLSSPCYGTITVIRYEQMGDQIEIKPDATKYPYYKDKNIAVIIFHIRPDKPLHVGQKLFPGERLGTHYTLDTYSDIAVRDYDTPDTTLSSVFEYMPPDIYALYGVYPEQMIISQKERNEFPSFCKNSWDQMPPPIKKGGPADWVSNGVMSGIVHSPEKYREKYRID